MTPEQMKKARLIQSELTVFERRKKALQGAFRIDIVSECNIESINEESKLFPVIQDAALQQIEQRVRELQAEFTAL
jgi:hypothetical protein